jgi:hypothetical protein
MAVFFYFAKFESRLVQLFLLGIVAVAVTKDIISLLRGTDVELHITNLDFISTGRAPAGYKSSSIPRLDIYHLKFEQAMSGDHEQPSGLYVEHHGVLLNPTTCVLPHIDEAHTEQVIEAIYLRFPDTAHTANSEPYLTSLNLNQRRRILVTTDESPSYNHPGRSYFRNKTSKTKAKSLVKPQNHPNLSIKTT